MPTMKQITNKEYEVEKAKGHVLLPDTIRFICEANGYDAEKIGQHFLKSCRKSARLNRDNEKRLRADMVQRRHLLKYIGLILAFRKTKSHISFFA